MESKTKFEAFGRELNSHFRKDFFKPPILKDNEGNPIIDSNHQFSNHGFIPDWQLWEII